MPPIWNTTGEHARKRRPQQEHLGQVVRPQQQCGDRAHRTAQPAGCDSKRYRLRSPVPSQHDRGSEPGPIQTSANGYVHRGACDKITANTQLSSRNEQDELLHERQPRRRARPRPTGAPACGRSPRRAPYAPIIMQQEQAPQPSTIANEITRFSATRRIDASTLTGRPRPYAPNGVERLLGVDEHWLAAQSKSSDGEQRRRSRSVAPVERLEQTLDQRGDVLAGAALEVRRSGSCAPGRADQQAGDGDRRSPPAAPARAVCTARTRRRAGRRARRRSASTSRRAPPTCFLRHSRACARACA